MQGDLPPQLERGGCEIDRRSLRHLAPHRGGAREHQMVERQCAKSAGEGCIALHHADFIGREELRHQQRHLRGRMGGEFTGLDHHPVAGSQRGNGRCQRKLHRVVPRCDHAHHAERLAVDHGAGRAAKRWACAPFAAATNAPGGAACAPAGCAKQTGRPPRSGAASARQKSACTAAASVGPCSSSSLRMRSSRSRRTTSGTSTWRGWPGIALQTGLGGRQCSSAHHRAAFERRPAAGPRAIKGGPDHAVARRSRPPRRAKGAGGQAPRQGAVHRPLRAGGWAVQRVLER